RHHFITAGNRDWNNGHAGLECHNEQTLFERPHSSGPAACSFRKSDEGMSLLHLSDSFLHSLQAAGTILSIDEDKSSQLHDLAQERNFAKLLLEHESNITRNRRKQSCRVAIPLMVGQKQIGFSDLYVS